MNVTRKIIKSVTICGEEFIALIASNDEDNLRSAWLSPAALVRGEYHESEFGSLTAREIPVSYLVNLSDEEMVAALDKEILSRNSFDIASYF